MKRMNVTILAWICLFTLSWAEPTAYADDIDFGQFKRMAILENGRIKPVETFARNLLLQFSGKRSYQGRSAVQWLAALVFDPDSVVDDKVFLVNNPEIPVALGFAPEKKRRYSFSQIEPGYSQLRELALAASRIEPKNRTPVENEIFRLYDNVNQFIGLSHVFQFALPHGDFSIANPQVRSYLELPDRQNEFSFYTLALRADKMRPITEGLDKKSPDNWSVLEQEIFRIVANLYQWSMYYKDLPFDIVPPVKPGSTIWYSPWDAINDGFHLDYVKKEVGYLAEAVRAYRSADAAKFDAALRQYNEAVTARAGYLRPVRLIGIELMYNALRPIRYAHLAYLVVCVLFIIGIFCRNRWFYNLAVAVLLGGFVMHTYALVARIIIMARPPVTNLYETFIFVSWVSVLLAISIEWFNRQWLGIMIGSIAGTLLLLIAGKFSAEGDTLKMLVAVLNSNFWLGTHVLTITMGYAGCCVAGLIGHVYILQRLFKPQDQKRLEGTYRILAGMLGLGLTLAFFGTMLGGIWADQSWGRFWGWDPKENGALMIVLWTAIVFHAKIARLIGKLGFAVGAVFGMVVVMWAWFGVNLLSIGLHSYGFTSGVANGLMAYVLAELIFMAVSVFLIKKNEGQLP